MNGELPHGRDGRPIDDGDHVAPHRITVRHTDLKTWMATYYPDQKPKFLFDEIERTTHAAINIETFQALQAERNGLKEKLDKALIAHNDLQREIKAIETNNDARDPDIDTSRRAQQHEIILVVIAALEFTPLEIPDGGKARIKAVCLTRKSLFTDDGFKKAWQEGLNKGLFKLINSDKFSQNQ